MRCLKHRRLTNIYMDIPDMSGYKLLHAKELLKVWGVENISVKLTTSPRLRNDSYNSTSRVVRQSLLEDGTLELLVCNSNV